MTAVRGHRTDRACCVLLELHRLELSFHSLEKSSSRDPVSLYLDGFENVVEFGRPVSECLLEFAARSHCNVRSEDPDPLASRGALRLYGAKDTDEGVRSLGLMILFSNQ